MGQPDFPAVAEAQIQRRRNEMNLRLKYPTLLGVPGVTEGFRRSNSDDEVGLRAHSLWSSLFGTKQIKDR